MEFREGTIRRQFLDLCQLNTSVLCHLLILCKTHVKKGEFQSSIILLSESISHTTISTFAVLLGGALQHLNDFFRGSDSFWFFLACISLADINAWLLQQNFHNVLKS